MCSTMPRMGSRVTDSSREIPLLSYFSCSRSPTPQYVSLRPLSPLTNFHSLTPLSSSIHIPYFGPNLIYLSNFLLLLYHPTIQCSIRIFVKLNLWKLICVNKVFDVIFIKILIMVLSSSIFKIKLLLFYNSFALVCLVNALKIFILKSEEKIENICLAYFENVIKLFCGRFDEAVLELLKLIDLWRLVVILVLGIMCQIDSLETK